MQAIFVILCTVSDAFQNYNIVPDLLAIAPDQLLNVVYPQYSLNLGNPLQFADVMTQPVVSFDAMDNMKIYTMLMADPDAPTRFNATQRSIRHWIIVNITSANISSGETVTPYRVNGPPFDSGYHRYIFLLYEQTAPVQFPTYDNNVRANWNVTDFVITYQLSNPIAGNFYLCRQDTPVTGDCRNGEALFGDACYAVFGATNWNIGENYCIQNGGHLTSVLNQFERQFVFNLAHDRGVESTDFWIGGISNPQQNGTWNWIDGQPFEFTNWRPGCPVDPTQSSCIGMNMNDGLWCNSDCGMQNFFICKYPKQVK